MTLESLSFVARHGETLSFWNIAPTGAWSADVEAGRSIAAEAIAFMARTDNPNLLLAIVEAMPRTPEKRCGVQVGFMTAVAQQAMGVAIRTRNPKPWPPPAGRGVAIVGPHDTARLLPLDDLSLSGVAITLT